MNWTPEELQACMMRFDKPTTEHEADPGPESVLQKKVMEWCRQRGYPVFHDNSRKKNLAGWPDLTIIMEDRRVLFVELKAEGGKLRKEQRHLKQIFSWLKHEIHVVRSFKKFLEVVGSVKRVTNTVDEVVSRHK